MSTSKHKEIPLFVYLGILQFATFLFAAVISLLYFRYADGKVFDFISRFLPDVSNVNMSVIGLMMLFIQVLGNFIAGLISFARWLSAGRIAILIGGSELLWMVYQFFMLHTHHVLVLLFFALSLAQVILGNRLIQKVNEANKEDRD